METMQKQADFVTVNVKHNFTEDELKEQSGLLAKAVKDKTNEEAAKKVAMSGFTERIKSLDAQINIHSSNINNGHAYVDKACELWLNYETNMRVYIDKNTGLVAKQEPFYSTDFQTKMQLEATEEHIAANNKVGDFAEGKLDGVILDKKLGKKVGQFKEDKKSGKIKPKPLYDVDSLHDPYGDDDDHYDDDLGDLAL